MGRLFTLYFNSYAFMSCWKAIFRQNFTQVEKLAAFLELSRHQLSQLLLTPGFSLNVPRRLAEKMAKSRLDDPILRQFLPLKEEGFLYEGFSKEPVQDPVFRRQSKLLHKYEGRALLVCTSACAMHCRFCFRQNFPYDTTDKLFTEELEVIRQDRALTEIILSGGDPLSLSDELLENLIHQLQEIPHLKRLRFHTRFPIGIPERLDENFLAILDACRLQVIFVIHCNHPLELDEEVLKALKGVQRLGIPILNQAVLLKGVNDNVAALKRLSERLVDHGILPYYLHQLDKVQGAAHFEVSEEKGLALIQELSCSLSGYGVPRYAKEVPGEASKRLLHPIHGLEAENLQPLAEHTSCQL